MDQHSKKLYFEHQMVRYNKCLEPTEQCVAPPIRSHSIQNSHILDALCERGHVIMPRMTHDSAGKPNIKFESIGRNKATTFAGLCSRHDKDIFKPIEQQELDIASHKHLFLLTYRSVLKEAHACLNAACKLQSGYLRRVESGLSPGDRPDPVGLHATAWVGNAYDTYCYKRKFDEAYLSKDYSRAEHSVIQFDNAPASIAVSALFSLDDIEGPDDVARLVLNIFPLQGKTIVIFSFLSEERPYAMQYIQRVLDASGPFQKYLISKLVLQHCENFVIAPVHYRSMSDEKKKAILGFYCDTLFRSRHDYENEHLFLF